MSETKDKVIVYAPRRLTKTERGILRYVAEHEGEPCTKGELAAVLGRNKKTIDRLVSKLKADGMLAVDYVWDDNGGQRANVYRLASESSSLVAQVLS